MTRLTLHRDGFERVYEMTWNRETIEQFLSFCRDSALSFEREIFERALMEQTNKETQG